MVFGWTVLFQTFILLLPNTCTYAQVCSKQHRYMLGDTEINGIIYYCCRHYVQIQENCEECPKGYTPSQNKLSCNPCPDGSYGRRCLENCRCTADQRCDNVLGCVSNSDTGAAVSPDQTKICPSGFTRNIANTQCVQCKDGWYGVHCAEMCKCSTDQRCDNIIGCVSPAGESDNVKTGVQKDIATYAGSIGSLMLVICFLSAYIFYRKKLKKSGNMSSNTNVDKSTHGTQEQTDVSTNDTYRFDHEYEEIDEQFLSDIVPTTCRRVDSEEEEEKEGSYLSIVDADEGQCTPPQNTFDNSTDNNKPFMSLDADIHDNDHKYTSPQKNYQSNPEDDIRSSGYLNPYQPIIITDVDIHQYTQPQRNDQSKASNDNSSSGYLNPYQPLSPNSAKTGEDYTMLKISQRSSETSLTRIDCPKDALVEN